LQGNKKWRFRGPKNYAGIFAASSIEAVSICNNHVPYDYLSKGYEDTKKNLKNAGCGIFYTKSPYITEAEGIQVVVIGDDSTSMGTSGVKERVASEIKKYKRKDNLVIVDMHWGAEYQELPTQWQKEAGMAQVIIIFVTAFGTGAYESQVHVLDKSFGEIPVENPVDVVMANVKTSIVGENVVFRIGDREFVVKPVGGILSPEEALKNLQFGSQVTFTVKDNKLASGVSAQISPNSILGQFVLEYNYVNNRFVPKIVDFQAYK
jgi:hypothetical protein